MKIKAATLISIVEKNYLKLYSITQKTEDFSQSTLECKNFENMKENSSTFIKKIKDFLDSDSLFINL